MFSLAFRHVEFLTWRQEDFATRSFNIAAATVPFQKLRIVRPLRRLAGDIAGATFWAGLNFGW